MSNHTLVYGLRARTFDTTDFQDGSVARMLERLRDIHSAGLPEDELRTVRARTHPKTPREVSDNYCVGMSLYGFQWGSSVCLYWQ